MLLGSTNKNITLLTTFFVLSTLCGLVYFEFNTNHIVLSIVMFYILNILGNWMTLHRYYSHKSFEFKNGFYKNFFTTLALLAGRGSVLGWVYIHRQHHAHSDTEKDPHSPKTLGFKMFGFDHYQSLENEKMKIFIVKDLMTKDHIFIHKYYLAIIVTFMLVLGLINLKILYFGYIFPCFIVHISQNLFNYYGHLYGYRNFETKDNSRNNIWLFPFILGEAWHNNHHHNPSLLTTKVKFYEIDPISFIVSFVKTKS